MKFKIRWRDIIAVAVTANLAHIALRGTNVSSASPSLMAFGEFEAFFQHPTIPLSIPIAQPVVVKDGNGNTEGLIVPGVMHQDRRSIGIWKYVDLVSVLNGDELESREDNSPVYLKSNTLIMNDDHDDAVAVKVIVESNESSGITRVGTIWSDGLVTLHTLEGNPQSKSIEQKWKVNLIVEHNFGRNEENSSKKIDVLDYQESALSFVRIPSYHETGSGVGYRNALIIGASITPFTDPGVNHEDESNKAHSRHFSYFALDVNDGQLVWKHTDQFSRDPSSSSKVKEHIGIQSENLIHHYERYRFDIISQNGGEDIDETEDCLHHFRVSTLNALPHFWSNKDDTKFTLAHFERNQRAYGKSQRKLKFLEPNVLVAHTRKGIEVVSLGGGSPVCHLSLLDGVYYDDIQQDGRIDHIHIIKENGGEPLGDIHRTPELLESFRAANYGVSKPSRE